jgi:hypothetical protein
MIRNACGADGLLTTLRLKKKKKKTQRRFTVGALFSGFRFPFQKQFFFIIIIIY